MMNVDDIKNGDISSPPDKDRFAAFDEVEAVQNVVKKKRLRANTRALIAAIAVASALALILVMLTIFLPSANDTPVSDTGSDTPVSDVPSYVLFDKSNESANTTVVQSVSFNNQSGKYEFIYDSKNDQYVIKSYEDLSLSENVNSLISTCISFTADKKVENPTSLNTYGLDKPVATATISYYDGTETTINVGNMVATKDGYYINQSGSDDVYIVVSDTANLFLAANWWYVSTTLITSPSAREDDEDGVVLLKELSVSGKNHDLPMTIRRPVPEDGHEFSYFKYVTTKPFLRGVDASIGDSLYGFYSLYAERAAILHPTAEQKNQLGFNDPYSVINITMAVEIQGDYDETQALVSEKSYYNNTPHKITVGCQDENGYYVVMVDDINAIFLVSPDSIKLLAERNVTSTIVSLLFLKQIETIGGVELRVDNTEYNFELSHYPNTEDLNDKLKVKVNGKSYDTAGFRSLYVLMMELERYAKVDSCPTGKADISLNLRLTDGSTYLGVDFYREGGSLYKARTTDGEIFSITASSVNTLLQQIDNYLSNKTVVE